jgi:hypothetical protein
VLARRGVFHVSDLDQAAERDRHSLAVALWATNSNDALAKSGKRARRD